MELREDMHPVTKGKLYQTKTLVMGMHVYNVDMYNNKTRGFIRYSFPLVTGCMSSLNSIPKDKHASALVAQSIEHQSMEM